MFQHTHVGILKKLLSEINILFICRIITKKGREKKIYILKFLENIFINKSIYYFRIQGVSKSHIYKQIYEQSKSSLVSTMHIDPLPVAN